MESDTIVIKAPAGTKARWVAPQPHAGAGMTHAQFDALAELLRLRGGPATDAARLVLVDGLSAPDAAALVGMSRTAVYNAVARCRLGVELAQRVFYR